jgi:hypothetical protein
MVNGWLKWQAKAMDNRPAVALALKYAHFRHDLR